MAAFYHNFKQHNTVAKIEIDIFRFLLGVLIRNENFDMKYWSIQVLCYDTVIYTIYGLNTKLELWINKSESCIENISNEI